MNKPGGRAKRILYIVMMLWGGVGILRWIAGGLPVYHAGAYGAGQNAGTVVLFLMFAGGLYGFLKDRKQKLAGGGEK